MKTTKTFTIALAFCLPLLFIAYGFKNSTEPIKIIDYFSVAKQKGQWLEMVQQEINAKRKPILFFTATWCGPCKEFKKSLTDPLMKEALNGATIIMIDGDIDYEKDNISKKYGVTAYPTFIRVDASGKQIKKTDGGAWDENIPKNMAPVMKQFLRD